jgi:hypothetical protein
LTPGSGWTVGVGRTDGRGVGWVPVDPGLDGAGSPGSGTGLGAGTAGGLVVAAADRGLELGLRVATNFFRDGLGLADLGSAPGVAAAAETSTAAAPAVVVGEPVAELPGRFSAAVEGRPDPLHPDDASRATSRAGTATALRSMRILHSVQVGQCGVKADGEAMTLP